eukprot:232756-Chlamydomonas_euryale.AAC.1
MSSSSPMSMQTPPACYICCTADIAGDGTTDMLIGQDWLVKEKAILNCGKNEITLTGPGLMLNPVHADTPCMDM